MDTHENGNTSESSARRARFEGQSHPKRRLSGTTVGLLACALFAAAFAYIVMADRGLGPNAIAAAQDVSLDVTQFDDGVARFYTYPSRTGQTIRFFVMKSSDGVIRAAFDACDTCFRERRGYRQQNDVMVCENCQQTFRSVDINVLKGGCNPAPLERAVVNGQVVLTAAAIEAGAGYF